MHAECKDDGKYETELLTRFHKQLQSTEDMMFHVFEALKSMRNRVSTNPVDKVAGLAYVMVSEAIPAYYESQSLEDAWTALVNSMLNKCRGQLFYFYPEPGNAGKKWRPSWDQLMSKPLPTDGYSSTVGIAEIDRDETGDEDTCDACCIEKGVVRGLQGSDRRGELIVKDKGGIEHGFEVTATHTYPIPDDTYTLIDSCSEYVRLHNVWVVGQSLPGGKFEKVSVLELSRQEHCRLNDLDITEQHQYILI
ncbi:uncharacterized protein EV420DRAFT_238848 [Desarmillaria tabescens]|uniref:Uncharacterized protein n=1 Tax=Armillaria tabescens TaxID=1929756 RepID=A0AA39J551_ARMTA|nr:uncharacterized protein EV420DRAFT_238848 [Desarmillaria tabescens]KAK0436326.1 hypothetical protein EV420DRAFT_238848 [Desarmillaria tabescens]